MPTGPQWLHEIKYDGSPYFRAVTLVRLANAYTIVHTWLGESLLREDGTGDATNKCSDDYLLLSARAIAHLLAVLEPVADTNIGSAENCGRIVMLERVARAIAAKEAPADG